MNMTKPLTIALPVALMTTVSAAGAENITLRVGSGHPIGLLAYTETAHEFFAPELERRVNEETEHTLTIQELHSGAVADVDEILQATRDGLLDIGFASLIFEPSNAFLHNFPLFMPFGTPDPYMATEAGRATLEAHPEMISFFEEEFGQKYLTGSCLENYGLGTDFEWRAFSDLEGQKIAGAGVNLDWIAGASPVTSNLNEAYQAIQTGVYDGYISAAAWWESFSLYEVAPVFTLTDFGSQYVNSVTINLDTWNSLPEEVQEILMEVSEEYEEETARVCAESEEKAVAALEEEGATVFEIDQQAREDWAEALKDFPNRMAQEANERGLPGTEVMTFYLEELERLGYEWPYRYEID
ncbi:C4-dicarboxylate TRAP transporter substrate-binding protein [Aquisalimonas lutea]|nr:C4-dicarboxylate TRAP transporter substrate-binding protein [Aquisalimonas lutea]